MAEVLPAGIGDERGKALAALVERFAAIDLTKLLIYRVDTVEASALPHLVDQFDLEDFVDATTPETTVRRLIKQAIELRRYMGTPWAVRRTLEAFGADVDLVEWWQEAPRGTPHTFAVTAWFERGLDEDDFDKVGKLVRWTKRTSQHEDVRVGYRTRGGEYIAAFAQSGETVTIYPFQPSALEARGLVPLIGGGVTSWDITTIRPL